MLGIEPRKLDGIPELNSSTEARRTLPLRQHCVNARRYGSEVAIKEPGPLRWPEALASYGKPGLQAVSQVGRSAEQLVRTSDVHQLRQLLSNQPCRGEGLHWPGLR